MLSPETLRTRLLILGLAATALLSSPGCGADPVPGADPPAPFTLRPEQADREGAVQKKWDRWVVWCGHNICDGAYTWQSPASGRYTLIWKDVKHKCAGASPYAVYVRGDEKVRSKIPKHGPCEGCNPRNIRNSPIGKYGRRADIALGTYDLERGDPIKLWVQNAFDCGIQNPGAYGGHFLEIVAQPAP